MVIPMVVSTHHSTSFSIAIRSLDAGVLLELKGSFCRNPPTHLMGNTMVSFRFSKFPEKILWIYPLDKPSIEPSQVRSPGSSELRIFSLGSGRLYAA